MSYVPVIIPISYDDDEEGEKVFFDIDEGFDRVRPRVEAVARRVYREDAYVTEDAIKYDEETKFHWFGWVVGFSIIICLLVFIAFNSNCIGEYSWKICMPNEYDVLWGQLFFPFGDDGIIQLLTLGLIILYTTIAIVLSSYVIALKWNVVTHSIKDLETTTSINNTIISFTIDDNLDYLFEKEMMKEFPKAMRRSGNE